MTLVWKDKQVESVRDLFDALAGLESVEEGQEFMRLYIADLRSYPECTNPESTAFANVGYVARYGDNETNNRIRRFTGAQHPIFG